MRMLNPIKAGLVALLLSVLAACQSPPQGLTAEQIATLREQGFQLTDEGWTLDISNKVLFANNVGALNPGTRQVVEALFTSFSQPPSVAAQALSVAGGTGLAR